MNHTPRDQDNFEIITASLKELYSSLPSNSPMRTSLIKTVFSNCEPTFISEYLEIDPSAVYKA